MRFITLVSTVLVSSSILASDSKVFSNPESSFYEKSEQAYYVSNQNGADLGWISKLDASGNVLQARWATGLHSPQGMRVDSLTNTLWVTDTSESGENWIVGINLDSPEKRQQIEVRAANDLNDLAIDEDGILYVSDPTGDQVFRIDPKAKGSEQISVFMKTTETFPNGVLVVGDRLYVASWGSRDLSANSPWKTSKEGGVYSVSLSSPSYENREYFSKNKTLGNLDGIEIDDKGNFYVSDWVNGNLFKISKNGEAQLLGNFGQGNADIGLDPKRNVISIPQTLTSKVFQLKIVE